MCVDIKLENLNESLTKKCDNEFQRQVSKSDGQFFVYFDQWFEGINIIEPSIDAQVITASFANSGCPVNGLRFGISLLRFTDKKWPINSHAAGVRYILGSIEILLNLKRDIRVISAIQKFESSKEFKKIIHIAHDITQRYCLTYNVCFDILAYIDFHVSMMSISYGEQ
jgi:hypothetical protein